MLEQHVFEYAVIRVVPRVEREEFLNVGVILYCSKQKFLQVRFSLNESKLQSFSADLDIQELKKHISAIDQICAGIKEAGPIAHLDVASRFRWLTATRSTVIQASKVHPGLCINADETLARLHLQLVL
jgi:hypothetical protein